MSELEEKKQLRRRIYEPDGQLPPDVPPTVEQQHRDDLALQLQRVETSIQYLVNAINRKSRAKLSEHNLVVAIEVAQRIFHEYMRKRKKMTSLDEDVEEEYMNVLEQAEEALAEHQTGGGQRLVQFEAKRWNPSRKMSTQLQRLNLTLERSLPKWMVTMIADALENKQMEEIVQDPELVARFAEEFHQTKPGMTRAVKAAVLNKLELLGAARLLPADSQEHHAKELYEMRHATAALSAEAAAEEWHQYVPALAEKYQAIHDHTTALTELVGRYYEFASGPEFDKIFTISHIDVLNLVKPHVPLHELTAAIRTRVNEVGIILRVLNEVHTEGSERRGAETRLWRAVQETELLLKALQRRTDVESPTVDTHYSAYLHLMGICEQVLNAIDSREWATLHSSAQRMELDDAIDVNPEAVFDIEVNEDEYNAAKYVCAENELDIPLYVKQYLANAYFGIVNNQEAQEENQRIDDAYEYIITEDRPRLVRRVALRDILPGMIRRAALELLTDADDVEGNEHRARKVLQQLIEDWKDVYPPIAEKYQTLEKYWTEMLDTIMNLYVQFPPKNVPAAKKR